MKIGTILVYFVINFISLSLQLIPIDDETPVNRNIHKTPVENFSDEDDFDAPTTDLRKRSKLTRNVDFEENQVVRGTRGRSSKFVEDVDDDYPMNESDEEEFNGLRRNKQLLKVENQPDGRFAAKSQVLPRRFSKKNSEEPRTLEGVPYEDQVFMNEYVRGTPIELYNDDNDFNTAETNLGPSLRQSERIRSNKIDIGNRRKNSQGIESFEDINVNNLPNDADDEEFNDVRRTNELLTVQNRPTDDRFSAKTQVNPRRWSNKNSLI